MCKTILIGVLTMVAVTNAFAKEEGHGPGNGGDACVQSVTRAKEILNSSLGYHEPGAFPEFEMNVLKWFFERTALSVVLRTEINGQEVDAKNYPDRKLIEFGRNRWCALDMETKVKILFHEYLGVMELEGTGDFRISDRLQVALNPTQFHCEVPLYHPFCFRLHTYNSQQHCVSSKSIKVSGPTLEWTSGQVDKQISELGQTWASWVPCKRIEVRSVGVNGYQQGYCAESFTPVNSCVRAN
jgi:hypothetical protein